MTFAALVYAANDGASTAERTILAKHELDYIGHSTPELDRQFSSRTLAATAVRSWPAALKRDALAFFLAHPQWSTIYTSTVVESFGVAPEFAPNGFHGTAAWLGSSAELAMGQLLARAYAAGEGTGLWQQLAPDWDRQQLAPARVDDLERAAIAYLRWDAHDALPTVTTLIDPLMPTGTGTNVILGADEVVLVESIWPRREDVELTFVHEFLHQPLQRLEGRSEALRHALAASATAFAGVSPDYGYTTWPSYVNETLIRCVSYRVMAIADRTTGFTYEPYISRRLRDYEHGTRDFEAFFVELLGELPTAPREATP